MKKNDQARMVLNQENKQLKILKFLLSRQIKKRKRMGKYQIKLQENCKKS